MDRLINERQSKLAGSTDGNEAHTNAAPRQSLSGGGVDSAGSLGALVEKIKRSSQGGKARKTQKPM
jgi:hypothetical protein